MTAKFPERDISPAKSFYDGLSDEERLVLAESEEWADFKESLVAVATHDVSDIPPDEVIANNERVTMLRFTTRNGSAKTFSFVHEYAIDLTKMKPVEYGLSNDALVNKWTALEWARARETAIAQALEIIDESSRPGLMLEFAQIERGKQVQF